MVGITTAKTQDEEDATSNDICISSSRSTTTGPNNRTNVISVSSKTWENLQAAEDPMPTRKNKTATNREKDKRRKALAKKSRKLNRR